MAKVRVRMSNAESEHVVLSDRAMAAIRAQTRGEFKQTGIRQADGTWLTPLSKDTILRLRKIALKGESYSDTIERVMATLPKDGSSRRGYQ
jgi:hypothetical protein